MQLLDNFAPAVVALLAVADEAQRLGLLAVNKDVHLDEIRRLVGAEVVVEAGQAAGCAGILFGASVARALGFGVARDWPEVLAQIGGAREETHAAG